MKCVALSLTAARRLVVVITQVGDVDRALSTLKLSRRGAAHDGLSAAATAYNQPSCRCEQQGRRGVASPRLPHGQRKSLPKGRTYLAYTKPSVPFSSPLNTWTNCHLPKRLTTFSWVPSSSLPS